MKNGLTLIGLMVLVGGILFFLLPQEEESKPMVAKERVVPSRVERVKDVLKVQTKSNEHKILYTTQEINTTMKTEISLHSEVDINGSNYKYVWKENENIIGFGQNINMAFPLGEHKLTCKIFDSNSSMIIAQESITVIAWRYRKEEYYSFDTSNDRYELWETKFFNHLKQLVLTFSNYDRKEFTYNEYGKVLEERYETFNNAAYSYTITYSYEGENLSSMEKVDGEGNIIESHMYDEEGKEIITEIAEEEFSEPIYAVKKKPTRIYNKDHQLIYMKSANGLYVKKVQYEKGKIVYAVTTHPRGKHITSYRYDKEGREIYREFLRLDREGKVAGRDIVTKVYNNEGEILTQERKYSLHETMIQHTLENWVYKDGKKLSYETEALVGVCPCTANLVKQKYTYHYDKNGTKSSYDYEYQREGDNDIKKSQNSKTVKSYTNSLE